MPLPQINMRLAKYSLIHKGKRFGGFDECQEQEKNRTCAEDILLSSDLSLITLEVKKGRGLPEFVFYYKRYNNDCTSAHNTKETINEGGGMLMLLLAEQ